MEDSEPAPDAVDPQVERLTRTRTRDELYDEANLLKIEGRAEMSSEQLATEICKAR